MTAAKRLPIFAKLVLSGGASLFLTWLILASFLPHLGLPSSPFRSLFAPVPRLSWLSTRGNQIVNERGEPQVLRGVNVSSLYWASKGWHPQAIRVAARDWKVQIIRTRVKQEEFVKDNDAFFKTLDREIIQPAVRNGLYVLINPQIGEGVDTPDAQTFRMWRAIAGRYRDQPAVLYDLLNEPHDVDPRQVRENYVRLIEAVREVHPRSLIFVTGIGWGRAINPYLKDPLPYDNLVYRANVYSKPGEFKGLFGDMASRYPVFLGEFGPGGFPTMTFDSVVSLLAYAREMGLGWTAWNFHTQGCPCLLADQQSFTPSEYGQIVKQALLEHAEDAKRGVREIKITPALPGEIYTDSLENSFVDLSWGADVDLMALLPEAGDDRAISVVYKDGYGGLFLHTHDPIDLSAFSRLEFQMNWGKNHPFDLQVVLNDKRLSESGKLRLPAGLAPNQAGWVTISLPLESFRSSGDLAEGIMIQNMSGSPHGPIYLDNLRFR
jgi:endoglucanase